MSNPATCDEDVFKNGHSICALDARSADAEAWVNMVAKESGQRVDWHYSGGVAHVLHLGDRARVRIAVHRLRNELRGTMIRVYEDGEPGLDRAGDPVPEGAIGAVTTSGRTEFL